MSKLVVNQPNYAPDVSHSWQDVPPGQSAASLGTLYFQTSAWHLTYRHQQYLQREVVRFFKDHPGSRIRVVGKASKLGHGQMAEGGGWGNQRIASLRYKSVKDFLTAKGIPLAAFIEDRPGQPNIQEADASRPQNDDSREDRVATVRVSGGTRINPRSNNPSIEDIIKPYLDWIK